MKKGIALMLSVIMVLLFCMVGCSEPTISEQTTDETIKIGWVGAISGDQAVYGECESNAVKMFFEEINNNGGLLGRQVEVICYDTRGDATECVNAVKRLTGQDKAIAIIGPSQSSNAIPISPVLEETKVIDITTTATNPKVTVDNGKVKPFNFRAAFIDPYQGAAAAGYAVEKLNAKKAAILFDVSDDYSQGLTQYFEENFIRYGGEIVAKEAFKGGDVDFRPQLTKFKESDPDIIFMPYFFKEVALSAKQARELGIDATLMGGDGWPSEQLVPMAGESVEGSYFINHLDINDPDIQEYRKKYESKFGKPIETCGFLANDACSMLVEAIKKTNSFDTIQIAKALEETDINVLSGRIKIGKDTHNPENKDAAIIKIVDGKFVFQEKYAVK